MAQTALLEKNAYLSILISHDKVVANLAYSHYAIGRHYIISDTTYFDDSYDNITDEIFWKEYFEVLERKFKWDFLQEKDRNTSMNLVKSFIDEGEGVSGITFTFHPKLDQRVKIQSILHTYIPVASIKIAIPQYLDSFLPLVGSKLGYSDIIYLHADVASFDLYRYEFENSSGKDRSVRPKAPIHSKIHWDKKQDLMRSVRDRRFMAFASTDITTSTVNSWANFITRPTDHTEDSQIRDLIRAFTTVQLSSIKSSKSECSKGFGERSNSLLVVSGRVANILDERELLISLLDGLELYGGFDLYIDEDNRFITYGEKFASGINSTDFILPKYLLIEKMDRVFIVESSNFRKKRKSLLYGELSANGKKLDDFYVLSGDLAKIRMQAGENALLSAKLTKGTQVYGEKESIILSNTDDSIHYDNVFFDGRLRPVVYGPDPASNRDKLKNWSNE